MEQKALLQALYRFARNFATDCENPNCRKAAERLASAIRKLLKEKTTE